MKYADIATNQKVVIPNMNGNPKVSFLISLAVFLLVNLFGCFVHFFKKETIKSEKSEYHRHNNDQICFLNSLDDIYALCTI